METRLLSMGEIPWRDYLELCKPRVVALMLLTSVVGMVLAGANWLDAPAIIWGNVGIALLAASAAAINHVVDQKVDSIMARTMRRPLAEGRLDNRHALGFSLILALTGMVVLLTWVNALTAWLTLASLIGYAVVYTGFLKRATPQNIVLGGLAGAAPPLLGWTTITNEIHPHALLLVLIIFAWTPPHFWALAVHRKAEYAKAGIPMLPVTHGDAYTKLHILLYTLMLFAASLLPFITGMCGVIYFLTALVLGGRFLFWSVVLLRDTRKHAAIKTFHYSIVYLMGLFVSLIIDHFVPLTWG
ncbi:MAG: protoheme IX farnesyltransferase [Hahellaceae bacterium]|nr:protoheme IX farnesyltransferase [Hahellaceae bacterium]